MTVIKLEREKLEEERIKLAEERIRYEVRNALRWSGLDSVFIFFSGNSAGNETCVYERDEEINWIEKVQPPEYCHAEGVE